MCVLAFFRLDALINAGDTCDTELEPIGTEQHLASAGRNQAIAT